MTQANLNARTTGLVTRRSSEAHSAVDEAQVAAQPLFDLLYVRRARVWLVLLLAAYFVVAVRYAALTPNWQAPDEPAHYNYIAHLAETATLPVLRMGDYNARLLAHLVGQGFPAGESIADLRYESYQPPLFYIAATPVYWAADGSLFALRLFNIYLGMAALTLIWLALELVFPAKPLIRLGATAFAALLPMHVAVMSAVNNDVLAELLILAATLVLLRWMRVHYYPDEYAALTDEERNHRQQIHLLGLGVLLGLGLLTKIYVYALLPIFAAVIVWTLWHKARSWRTFGVGVRRTLWMILPALAVALPMWLRNLLIYPGWDFLALRWHDLVVYGQSTTEGWIAEYGSVAYIERAFTLTFRSFWGVFGWLSTMMDERVYTAALIFSGVLFVGLLWASVRLLTDSPDTDMDTFQVTVLAILGILLLAVGASYIWYNLKFVQHQGRYLFWGMLAIGTVVALGWREVLHPLQGTIAGLLTLALGGAMFLGSLIGNPFDKWTMLMVVLVGLFLLMQPVLLIGAGIAHPWRPLNRLAPYFARPVAAHLLFGLRSLAWATPFLLLFVLNWFAPAWYIVPQLGGR